MGLELMSDRYPLITSQTRYPLRHAASCLVFQSYALLLLVLLVFLHVTLSVLCGHSFFIPATTFLLVISLYTDFKPVFTYISVFIFHFLYQIIGKRTNVFFIELNKSIIKSGCTFHLRKKRSYARLLPNYEKCNILRFLNVECLRFSIC